VNRPLCLIVNPAAGNGRALSLLPHARAVLEGSDADHRVVESASLAHAEDLAAAAADRGEVVVAVGGDGMVGALAGVASGAGAWYGIVPAGRGNDLAGVLGIPADPAAAARVLLSGQPRQIDLIGVSAPGHAEAVVAGSVYAGLPALAGEVANATRLLPGSLVYPLAALRVLAGWRPARFTLQVGGPAGDAERNHEFDGYAVVIANSPRFGAGMQIAPPALIDDGLLDLVFLEHAPKLTFVRALLMVKDGKHVDLPSVTLHRGADVRLTMSRDLPAAADGESLASASPLPAGTELRIRALPSALTVMVPA
jgi:YegS/Rv2252/BmrU family lipid kinase